MKKRNIILIVAMALVVCALSAFVLIGCNGNEVALAEEIVGEGEPVVEPIAVYTMADEDGTTWTITILDETNCVLTDGTTETALTYTLIDGILTLTNPVSEATVSFVVNVDNTIAPYVPETEGETEAPTIDWESIVVDAEVDEEKLTAQVTKIIEDFLGNYLQESMVAEIISWLIETGVLGALVVIFLKYRKFRHTTIADIEKLANEKIKESLDENFKGMDANTAKMICNAMEAINDLSKKFDILLQATALSQDPSSEGRIAMLQLVQGISDDKKVVEKIEEIKDEIVAEQVAVQEVKDQVAGEYKSIDIDVF
jgi:hypothetical protein